MTNRKICVMRDYPTKMWRVYWNREGVSATVWDATPFCAPKRTAREALALARMSVNDLSPFMRSTGRGSTVYYAEQVRNVHRDVELRGDGYAPIDGSWQFRDPATAFRQPLVMSGDAVVFQIGADIWGIYARPEYTA